MPETKNQALGLWIHGISGRMGREIQQTVPTDKSCGFRLVGGSDRTFEGDIFLQNKPVTPELLASALRKDSVSVVLDFSSPEGNQVLLEAIATSQPPPLKVVIGTTGLSPAALQAWEKVASQGQHAVLVAPNTSIGILLMAHAIRTICGPASELGFDIEIVETHHRLKADAPSGTAKFIASAVMESVSGHVIREHRSGMRKDKEIGIHAVRGGGVFGEHDLRLISANEELKISHRAFSRKLFATGAISLASWLTRKNPGFYRLSDVRVEDLGHGGRSHSGT